MRSHNRPTWAPRRPTEDGAKLQCAGITTGSRRLSAADPPPAPRLGTPHDRARPRGASSRRAEQGAIKLVPGRRRLALLLKGYLESLDDMRGERAHAWREVDASRYWCAHYRNAYALGRKRADKSCHFWIASYKAMLRWAGLANDWLVDEIECGASPAPAMRSRSVARHEPARHTRLRAARHRGPDPSGRHDQLHDAGAGRGRQQRRRPWDHRRARAHPDDLRDEIRQVRELTRGRSASTTSCARSTTKASR